MRAYTYVNEGNAFKLDSENADEIAKGERDERSPFESQTTPEMQPAKMLPEEQLNVEFARHREAFEKKFSEKHKIILKLERPSLCALCAVCTVFAVCAVCAFCAVCVITMRICFCVSLSAALATDANIAIKMIADFILSQSAQRTRAKGKTQNLTSFIA